MLNVRIGTRDDSALFKSPAEFNNLALEGELFVDFKGSVYVSAYTISSLRAPNTPSITLLDLKNGCIYQAEMIDQELWPLRRLDKSESVTLQNGE